MYRLEGLNLITPPITLMTRPSLFILLVSLITTYSFAKEKYVQFDEIYFESAIEKSSLESLLNNGTSAFDAFLAIAPEDSLSFEKWKTFYDGKINELKHRKKPKKLSKDIKQVYE